MNARWKIWEDLWRFDTERVVASEVKAQREAYLIARAGKLFSDFWTIKWPKSNCVPKYLTSYAAKSRSARPYWIIPPSFISITRCGSPTPEHVLLLQQGDALQNAPACCWAIQKACAKMYVNILWKTQSLYILLTRLYSLRRGKCHLFRIATLHFNPVIFAVIAM